ncbi:hypothetical protein AB0I89_24310 [Micromonospora sp. NPDC049801]|uniref:hypothetical protein n=1 Tax=unclassified Micromonospora TaxID=2617518 RepID=UPI0033CA1228
MKVRVPLVIEVDPQEWANINGQIVDADGKFTIADLREDIRTYVLNAIQNAALIDEVEASVSLS